MKYIEKDKETGSEVTYIHLYDLPVLAVKGHLSDSMIYAMLKQGKVNSFNEITDETAYRRIALKSQSDRDVIRQEEDIVDADTMTPQKFGIDLHEKEKKLRERIVRQKLHGMTPNVKDSILQQSYERTIDLILSSYIISTQSRENSHAYQKVMNQTLSARDRRVR